MALYQDLTAQASVVDVDALHFGRLESKLAIAAQLFRRHGERLRAHGAVAKQLASLDAHLLRLENAMKSAGLGRRCGMCAKTSPGGCCDASIAEETDCVLLLINLLLDAQIEMQATDLSSCTFVGPRGCSLRAKPHLCWNYNCYTILRETPAAQLECVKTEVGQMLQQLGATEEALLAFLRELNCKTSTATQCSTGD